MNVFGNMCSEITFIKLLSHLPGESMLIYDIKDKLVFYPVMVRYTVEINRIRLVLFIFFLMSVTASKITRKSTVVQPFVQAYKIWTHHSSASLSFCEENPPVINGFPSQRACNEEKSPFLRHHQWHSWISITGNMEEIQRDEISSLCRQWMILWGGKFVYRAPAYTHMAQSPWLPRGN